MADFPEVNAGIGGGGVEAVQARNQAALERTAAANEKLAQAAEAKLARVSGAGMGASDSLTVGGLVHADPFLQGIDSDRSAQKRNEKASVDTVEESFTDLKKATATVTAALLAMGQVVELTSNLRASGAKHVGSITESLGESLRSLGGTKQQQEDLTSQVIGGKLGTHASADEIADLFAAGDAAKGMLPGNQNTFNQTVDVIRQVASGDRSVTWGRKALATGRGFPAVGGKMASMGTTDDAMPGASAASATRTDRDRMQIASEDRGKLYGNAVNDYDAQEEAWARDSVVGSLSKYLSYTAGRWINRWSLGKLSEQNADAEDRMHQQILHTKEIARNTRPPPPSTTGGR